MWTTRDSHKNLITVSSRTIIRLTVRLTAPKNKKRNVTFKFASFIDLKVQICQAKSNTGIGGYPTVRSVRKYGKKFFSLAITFNALLTLVYAVEILAGVWNLKTPYVPDNAFFWLLIPAIVINIFPAITIGQIKSGRLWFHHYVYGFLVLAISLTLLMINTHVSPIDLFTKFQPSASVNVGRFFIVGGLTLILDDLPDVSKRLSRALSFVKSKAYQRRRIIHAIQCLMGFVSLYFSLAIGVFIIQKPEEINVANLFLVSTLFITSLTSFGIVKRKIWLNITPEKKANSKIVISNQPPQEHTRQEKDAPCLKISPTQTQE